MQRRPRTQTWEPKVQGKPSPEALRKAFRLLLHVDQNTHRGSVAAGIEATASHASA